jgi:hypothetical protein
MEQENEYIDPLRVLPAWHCEIHDIKIAGGSRCPFCFKKLRQGVRKQKDKIVYGQQKRKRK